MASVRRDLPPGAPEPSPEDLRGASPEIASVPEADSGWRGVPHSLLASGVEGHRRDCSLASLDDRFLRSTRFGAWLFAALGLTALGCGGGVTTPGLSSGERGAVGRCRRWGRRRGSAKLLPEPHAHLQPDGKESGFCSWCADGAIDRAAPGDVRCHPQLHGASAPR